jgi:ATP-dependent Clp protease, protease subunit
MSPDEVMSRDAVTARDEAKSRVEGPAPPQPPALENPQLVILGDIEIASTERFLCRLREIEESDDDLVLELTTLGGDAEMARRIVLEIDRVRRQRRARGRGRFLFLGKTIVYSAGITIMAAFPPADRWLSGDTMLMIHGRTLEKTIELSGPIRASLPQVDALHDEIKAGLALEEEGFARLVEGSAVPLEELRAKAAHSWFLSAAEAQRRGLVAGIWKPAP